MHVEYKRDMNHNYLVIYKGEELDTSSYQVRMLVGNIIPSLLKCRLQGIDGEFALYYDITSRQALSALYEGRKMGHEDLRMIFGAFIRAMEDAAEYLMNPGLLILKPEYMFLQAEKKEILFCFFPGEEMDMKKQLQEFMEYLLPHIDHQDEGAVRIGYGIYRRALEDGFHLEHIKEELFREKEADTLGIDTELLHSEKNMEEECFRETGGLGEEKQDSLDDELWRRGEDVKPKKHNKIFKKVIFIGLYTVVVSSILILKVKGVLSQWEVFTLLGVLVVGMAAGMLFSLLRKKIRGKKEEKNRKERKDETLYMQRSDRKEEALFQEWEKQEFMASEKMDEEKPVKAEEAAENERIKTEDAVRNCGETVVLSMNTFHGPASLVSREPGLLAAIYLEKDLTIIGKLETASDAVIDLPTVSRVHAKIRKKNGEYYLSDLNSRNGTTVNGRLLKAEEEYCLQNEDEVDFAQARYVFLGK